MKYKNRSKRQSKQDSSVGSALACYSDQWPVWGSNPGKGEYHMRF